MQPPKDDNRRDLKSHAYRFFLLAGIVLSAQLGFAVGGIPGASKHIKDLTKDHETEASSFVCEGDCAYERKSLLQAINIYNQTKDRPYDFRECSDNPKDPEYLYCRATGRINCDGLDNGVGFVASIPGAKRDVIFTSAHALRRPDGKRYYSCTFQPYGTNIKIPIIADQVENERPHDYDKMGRNARHDLGMAILEKKVSQFTGAAGIGILTEKGLEGEFKKGARFVLIGEVGDDDRIVVSDQCGPKVSQPYFIDSHVTEEFKHDCNAVDGFSGGPMVLIGEGYSTVFCISSGTAGSSPKGTPFDPTYNPNSCMKITKSFFEKAKAFSMEPIPKHAYYPGYLKNLAKSVFVSF